MAAASASSDPSTTKEWAFSADEEAKLREKKSFRRKKDGVDTDWWIVFRGERYQHVMGDGSDNPPQVLERGVLDRLLSSVGKGDKLDAGQRSRAAALQALFKATKGTISCVVHKRGAPPHVTLTLPGGLTAEVLVAGVSVRQKFNAGFHLEVTRAPKGAGGQRGNPGFMWDGIEYKFSNVTAQYKRDSVTVTESLSVAQLKMMLEEYTKTKPYRAPGSAKKGPPDGEEKIPDGGEELPDGGEAIPDGEEELPDGGEQIPGGE
jgi:hypothetical protein